MTIDDVLGAELATGRAVPTAETGEPYESWHVISDDGRVELGIWGVTTVCKTYAVVKTG